MDDELDVTNATLDEIVTHNAQGGKQHIINQNLKQIQFRKSKLRYAQESYYGNGKSPLTRGSNSNNASNDLARAPVHSRLGRPTTRHRAIPIGVTTDSIMPKTRLRIINKNNINTRGNNGKFLRLHRGGLAQQRLERIRRQQAEAVYSSQLVQPLSKFRIKQRRRPNFGIGTFQSAPMNYTIEVPNNSFENNQVNTPTHSIQDSLNSNIEMEIQRIQTIHVHPDMDIQMLPALPVNTIITLDERFTSLP